MPTTELVILEAVSSQIEWIRCTLKDLVEMESPSEDQIAVSLVAQRVASIARPLGAELVWNQFGEYGDVLELDFAHSVDTKPILLLGHLDTVWSSGTLAAMPWKEEKGRFWGPGVLDMKAGVVMALAALKVLRELGLERSVTMLLNSDEEVGSPVSRPLTERLALESKAVYVLEPAQGLAYKTARKGVGQYDLHVTGVAAHAGVDFEKGNSAIREMARLIETVSNFTDQSKKRTVNCGRMFGGTRSNVVAAEATVEVDVRISTVEDAEIVDELFRSLRCADSKCRLEISGGINRPPMERTAGTIALFEKARIIASKLGFALTEASTGGGSDGNFTSALGVPTLDGMGAVGDGAHAAHESVLIEHLVPRTALLAAMIARG